MKILVSMVVLSVCMLASPAFADEASHQVMDHWVGDWKGGVAGAPKGSLAHIAATPDHAQVVWTLDNHFLQGINSDASGKPVGVWMMHFNPKTSKYQVWFFNSQGGVSLWSGTWSEPDSTMTWEAHDNATGAIGAGHTKFADGKQEWELKFTEDGKVVVDGGSLTKK